VSRRLEGKSSIKRENRSAGKNSVGASPTPDFKKGLMTGINHINSKPLSSGLKNTQFPKKKFIVPAKIVDKPLAKYKGDEGSGEEGSLNYNMQKPTVK